MPMHTAADISVSVPGIFMFSATRFRRSKRDEGWENVKDEKDMDVGISRRWDTRKRQMRVGAEWRPYSI
jgi:hypothetical protein